MSGFKEYRWNRDWGMVELLVSGTDSYYRKSDVDAWDPTAEIKELKADNKQLTEDNTRLLLYLDYLQGAAQQQQQHPRQTSVNYYVVMDQGSHLIRLNLERVEHSVGVTTLYVENVAARLRTRGH